MIGIEATEAGYYWVLYFMQEPEIAKLEIEEGFGRLWSLVGDETETRQEPVKILAGPLRPPDVIQSA